MTYKEPYFFEIKLDLKMGFTTIRIFRILYTCFTCFNLRIILIMLNNKYLSKKIRNF